MAKRRVFEGEVEECCHRISFWYEIGRVKLTEELKAALTSEAEERSKTCIIDGCWSGELSYCHVGLRGKEREFTGWWSIEKSS